MSLFVCSQTTEWLLLPVSAHSLPSVPASAPGGGDRTCLFPGDKGMLHTSPVLVEAGTEHSGKCSRQCPWHRGRGWGWGWGWGEDGENSAMRNLPKSSSMLNAAPNPHWYLSPLDTHAWTKNTFLKNHPNTQPRVVDYPFTGATIIAVHFTRAWVETQHWPYALNWNWD